MQPQIDWNVWQGARYFFPHSSFELGGATEVQQQASDKQER